MADNKEVPKEDLESQIQALQTKFFKSEKDLATSRQSSYDRLQTSYDILRDLFAHKESFYLQLLQLQKQKIIALEAERLKTAKREDNIAAPPS